MKKNFIFKRVLTLVLAVMMLVTAAPVNLLAEPGGASGSKKPYEIVFDDKSVVRKEDYINKTKDDGLPIKPYKLGEGEEASKIVKNPKQPDIYTIRADYKVKRGNDYVINYQPYIVSVGENIPKTDQDKIQRDIDLPEIDGYTSPTKKFHVDYEFIQKEVKDGFKYGNKGEKTEIPRYGDVYKLNWPFNYKPKKSNIKVVHVFQHLYHKDRYGEEDLSDEEKGDTEEAKKLRAGIKKDIIRSQSGNTGDIININHVEKNEMLGYEPEVNELKTQIPESTKNFVIYVRYNRKHYSVKYNTKEGTEIPNRTLYYEQRIPKLALGEVPTKLGSDFLGWMPSVDLETTNGKTYKANEIIKVATGTASTTLDANLIMPASDVTFTAVWKDKPKADYAVQFWAEKADHVDNATTAQKYEYMGTRVYKDAPTGTIPNLDKESPGPVKVKENGKDKTLPGLNFPDLDKARLAKIWNGATFNRGKDLYLNKFFVYNKALTDEQNKDPENANLIKSVSSTGQTVYNIYYDRQVYELYFTKSNALPTENTFYPEIWGYDETEGEVVKKGGPGNPYHYKARFNQLMLGWPNDAMQTKGFDENMQSFGWGPNFSNPNWPTHLDTPPYRLNADEFLDMTNYDKWGGYTKKIDKGDGSSINLNWDDYKILSFGIKQAEGSMPHHMDFWMDGFKDTETIIRYDLYRYKADTNSDTYSPRYPKVQGFTGKGTNETPEYLDSDGIDAKNDEREDVTPFPAKTYTDMYGERPVGKMQYIKAFFNNGDEWGDPDGWDGFNTNGYLKFEYSRNKYPLRFNYDPLKPKDDSEFDSTNQLDTFYEFPLKVLSPDLVDSKLDRKEREYFKDNPKNLLDNPENLKKLGLTDLVETKNKKLIIKRPEGLADQMEFKGWALDPAGTKLIWANEKETMPSHPVNLYAKWGPPDTKWTVTLDPNGGELKEVKAEMLTTDKRTIAEGDINDQKINTYPKKEANDGDKQKFTVIHLQKLKELPEPKKDGFDFMGWEFVRYEKDKDGKDTINEDKSYFDTYKVSELYTFGNEVVSNVHLRAIWIKNELVDVELYHHFLDKDYKEIKGSPEHQTLKGARSGSYLGTVASRQDEEWLLAPDSELADKHIKAYDDYINLTKDYTASKSPRTNTYNQYMIVTPEEVDANGHRIKSKENEFHFFYRRFRKREYTVKYIDERYEKNPEDAKASIIPDEKVVNGNRHTDARNYRPIPGWVLADVKKSQQQLFFDVDEKTNEFLGINKTGKKYITFIYKDVRVIETKKDAPVPDGYVRVTFKAADGGSFGKDAQGKDIKELYYDVIKGLRSDLLPVPGDPVEDDKKEEGKFYITPEAGKNFIKWDSKPLLNANTIIEKDDKDYYTFTAKFDWSDVSVKGLVRTEAFDDNKATSSKDWSNNFAPTLEELKKLIIYKVKDKEKPLPEGTKVSFESEVDTSGSSEDIKPITDDKAKKAVYDKVKEHNKADTEELVRIEKIKTLIKFKDGKNVNVLEIPVTIYKNRYEALTTGDKPLFLSEAEKKPAKEGGLEEILKDTASKAYVKVTVAPTRDLKSKDNKVYYVNPKAWVDIPELSLSADEIKKLGFTSWTADKANQNEGSKANGVFDFNKRHKFTEDTVITPVFTKDVIPQTGTEKPVDTPNNYVKVEFVPTDKGTMTGTTIFWVNPGAEVTIPVSTPIGKTYYTFKEWKIGANAEGAVYKPDLAKNFTEATIITATYNEAKNVFEYDPSVPDPKVRPDGYIRITFVAKDGIKLTEEKAYYVKKDAKDDRGDALTLADPSLAKPKYKEDLGYKFDKWDPADTTVIRETDIVVTAKSIPLDDVIEKTDKNPKAPEGYKTVTFKALPHGHLEENNKKIDEKVYFVNPNKFVTINPPKTKADTGYKFGSWSMDATNYNQYKDNIIINASFNLEKAVVPKTQNDDKEKPQGFKTVKFEIKGEGGEIVDGETTTYFVDSNSMVSIDPPAIKAETGYKFVGWSKDTTKPDKYTKDLTITGTFEKLADIIPEKEGGVKNSQPEGYVKVTFDKGEHAKSIDGQAIYFVNPKADPKKTLGDPSIKKPNVKAETGYKFTGWDEDNTKIIEDSLFVVAQYSPIDDVIPMTKNGAEQKKPDGYITVTFEGGDHGSLEGNTVVYINPNKAVELEGFAPKVKPATGYDFADWDRAIKEKVQYNNGEKIKAIYNKEANISTNEKPGYVKVIFKDGGKGTLDGTTEYWVNPGVTVTVPAPDVNANIGYRFDSWDKSLSVNLTNTQEPYEITAKYKKLDDIVPGDQSKPSGYLTVTFDKGENGAKLEGQSVYYVNPTAGKTLADITKPKATADIGYKQKTGDQAWNKSDTTQINGTDDITVKAQYDKIKNIVSGDQSKPEGYVTVIFRADANGKLEGNVDEIKYYVNPRAGVKLVEGKTAGENEIAVPKTIANANNVFEAWYEKIDTNPITSNKEYVARFTTSQVKLTYKVGLGSGDVPASVTVPYNTTIRLASSIGLSKKNYYFDGWLIDGKKYKVGEEFVLTKNTEAVAQWDRGPNVIPYNSENPKARPDDSYIRVSFKSDEGIELEKLNSYYVKKGAGLFLSNTDIVAPIIKEKTGYKSLGWDNTLRGPIGEDDIVITAKSKSLDNVIPAKDSNGDPVPKPDGYKIVKFVAGANGELREKNDTISEKTYYVNSEKYVTLTPPTTHGLVGYKFASWDKDATIPTVYTKDETIISASFVEEDAVSTKFKEGYKIVTFEISGDGGKIAEGETKVYYVDPKREVTINPPQTKAEVGYVFEKWDKDPTTKKKYTEETTTVRGSFKPINPIMPSTDANGKKTVKPEGYVTVTFDNGEHGSMTGQKVYYVNPKVGKKLSDITKPTIKAHVGYKFDKWDTPNNTEIKQSLFVIAEYTKLDDVIPKTTNDETEKPDGYITVTFSTEPNGKINGKDETEKVVYVNPNKAVVLESQAPEVMANAGYTFAGWDTSIHKAIQYKDKDVIEAIYSEEANISTEEKPGYVKVEFNEGSSGSLLGTKKYWVKPGVTVTVPAPKVKPNTGYSFDDWDVNTSVYLTAGAGTYTITAIYKPIDDIVPGDLDKPKGYNTVKFVAGANGRLSGTKIFYVNPKKVVDLRNKADLIAKEPNLGYENGTWSQEIKAKKYDELETIYKFTFNQLKNVDIVKHPGYVKVEFVAGDNGYLEGGNTTYYVNPEAGVKVGSSDLLVPIPKPTANYSFDKWILSIDTDELVTSDRKFVAQFKPSSVTLTYDLNGGEGTKPNDVTAPYGTAINIASDKGITKKYYSFAGWKIGNDTYQAGDEYTLRGDATAIAQWTEDQNIIPYDMDNPIARPEGFVRLSFAAEKGLTLKHPKYYYVRKETSVSVLLGNPSIIKPEKDVKLGYKFIGWDKSDDTVINSDMVLTAKSKKLDPVIDSKEGSRPEGYVTVEFVAGANGRILDGNKTYYVNPSKYVRITPPITMGNKGYEFGAWSQDATVPTVYKTDTTITATFNRLNNVIPKTKTDESEKPNGYKKVTFVIDQSAKGNIAVGETITYFVNPNSYVFINPPKTSANTGYEFEKWDNDTTVKQKYTEDTTVKGSFKLIEAVIPSTDESGEPNAKPDGYVEVTFLKGDNGKLDGQTVYYVNPNVNKKVNDLKAPTIDPDIGFAIADTDWEILGAAVPAGGYKDEVINKNLTLQAKYKKLEDVMNKDKLPGGKVPKGYIKVTFDTTDQGNNITKDVYVNKLKAVVLKDQAPEFTAETGYTFAGWDTQITKNILYSDGDVIKALFNEEKYISTSQKPGYVKVTLIPTDKAIDTKEKVYYVNPNEEVTIPAPTVKAKTGYEQKAGADAWDKPLTQTFTGETIITAQYTKLDNIIPGDQAKPEGYVEVKFVADHGTLSGTKTYYVNPNETVDLTSEANGLAKEPNVGYKAKGSWDKAFIGKFSDGYTFTFTFDKEEDVIKIKGGSVERPKGYVKVTFIPTDKAIEQKKTSFYVNPNAEATFTGVEKPEGREITDTEVLIPEGRRITDRDMNVTTYTFVKWTVTRGVVASWDRTKAIKSKFTQDTDITAIYKETVKPSNEPRAKTGVVKTVGDKAPEAKDLIANKYEDTDNEGIRLEKGTTFNYVGNQAPTLDTEGTVTAQVEVHYPSGKKTVVVEVPIKVVRKVVQQYGTEKPPVPKDYVKVVVDTTANATENTRFVKVFWVKSGVEVMILDITAPTGKEIVEGNVKKTNVFVKWKLKDSNPEKFYKKEIKDTFTKEETIIAVYEFKKNVEPQGKNGQVLAMGSNPSAKDFIKNVFDDADPNNKDNLPAGTQFEFVAGQGPNTSEKCTNKITKIKVTYPNGEVKEVPVKYNVSADVIEQTGPTRPDAPPSFVKVTVDTTDKATADTKFTRTFWVDPLKVVTIPVDMPSGAVATDSKGNIIKDALENDVNWKFKGWKSDEQSPRTWDGEIKARFTYETNITAQYESIVPEPSVEAKLVETYVGREPELDDYEKAIKMMLDETGLSFDKNVSSFEITKDPVVSKAGLSAAEVKIEFNNGTSKVITVPVKVHELLYPADTNGRKTAEIPDYYVKVTVDPTLLNDEPQIQVYYVNPKVDVVIPLPKIRPVDDVNFLNWIIDEDPNASYDGETPRKFDKDTKITAQYDKAAPPTPEVELITVNQGDNIAANTYIDHIKGLPNGISVEFIRVITEPDTSRAGDTVAVLEVLYSNGERGKIAVPVKVLPKHGPDPRPSEPQIIYRDRIVEKEKIVEKIVKIKDNERLKELRYMQGYNGKFRPYDGLRRCEAAQILANALKADGYAYDPFYPISYTDIGDSWYTEAVRIVSQAGVFQGYNDGTFKPEGKITRAEWVATLRRFQDLKKVSGNDMGLSMGHWATEEIEAAYQAGWLGVYQDGIAHFDADKPITRQEVAYVSNKAFDRVLDKAYLKRNVNNMIHYKDINPSMPLYEDILCASNTLLTDGRYYKANAIDMDTLTFNIITDDLLIYQKKFQFFTER